MCDSSFFLTLCTGLVALQQFLLGTLQTAGFHIVCSPAVPPLLEELPIKEHKLVDVAGTQSRRFCGMVGVIYGVRSASSVQVLKGGMEQEWASELENIMACLTERSGPLYLKNRDDEGGLDFPLNEVVLGFSMCRAKAILPLQRKVFECCLRGKVTFVTLQLQLTSY